MRVRHRLLAHKFLAGVALIAGGLAVARQSAADSPALDPPAVLLSTDSWTPSSKGDVAIDGGIVIGMPTALPTGLTTGVGAGIAIAPPRFGDRFAWGARIAWGTATESSMAWEVTHHDVRLRATGAIQHALGRGTLALRLGVGGTLVYEARSRNQGERAGLMGSNLRTSTIELVPAADLDAVVHVGVAGPWRVVMSGGPSLAIVDGAQLGWTAQLGVAWQP